MKTIKDLTPEIRKKIEIYKKECVSDLYSGKESKEWKKDYTIRYIEYIYKLAKQKNKPVIIIANNLIQYKLYFNLLFNSKYNKEVTKIINLLYIMKNNLKKFKKPINFNDIMKNISKIKMKKEDLIQVRYHYNYTVSEYSRVYLMWYKFIKDEFNIKSKKSEELDWLYDNVRKSNISRCFFCKNVVLVLRMPQEIKRNNIGFHSIDNNGAIIYDNQKIHYINGRKMPDYIFDKYFSKTLTFKDFKKESNEDVKAGIITLIKENEGNEGLLKFLNAVEVDKQTVIHNNGYSEVLTLYKTKEKYSILQDSKGNTNVPYAWISMICPSTGTNYLIDTCPSFTNVVECAKWHRPEGIPLSIPYFWQSAN